MATLAIFCSPRGYKKRLLGSLPKPGAQRTVCGPRALTLGQIVPKRNADGKAQPSLGTSDVESVSSKIRV